MIDSKQSDSRNFMNENLAYFPISVATETMMILKRSLSFCFLLWVNMISGKNIIKIPKIGTAKVIMVIVLRMELFGFTVQ